MQEQFHFGYLSHAVWNGVPPGCSGDNMLPAMGDRQPKPSHLSVERAWEPYGVPSSSLGPMVCLPEESLPCDYRDEAENTNGLDHVPGSGTFRTGSYAASDVSHEPLFVDDKACSRGSAVFTGRTCPIREEKERVDATH